jgi:hypothetical protein
MGVGASIFLIAIGAILTFALDVSVGGVDIDVVGWILMAAGVIGLIFTTMIWGPRRRASTTVTEEPTAYEPTQDRTYTGTGRTTGYRRTEEERTEL